MCLSSPSIPAPPKPPQAAKAPDTAPLLDASSKRRAGGMTGGTLLTGPSGIALQPANQARATLLGQ